MLYWQILRKNRILNDLIRWVFYAGCVLGRVCVVVALTVYFERKTDQKNECKLVWEAQQRGGDVEKEK